EELKKYIKIVDGKIEIINDLINEGFNDRIEELLREWVADGTLDHIINTEIFNKKADIDYVDNEIKKHKKRISPVSYNNRLRKIKGEISFKFEGHENYHDQLFPRDMQIVEEDNLLFIIYSINLKEGKETVIVVYEWDSLDFVTVFEVDKYGLHGLMVYYDNLNRRILSFSDYSDKILYQYDITELPSKFAYLHAFNSIDNFRFGEM